MSSMKIHVLLLISILTTGCRRDADNSFVQIEKPCVDSEKLGLRSITIDEDSLEIRIWYSYSFLDRIPVVSIRQSKTGNWSGRLHMIVLSFDEGQPKIKEIKIKNLHPEMGWLNFYKSLEALDILEIPDMRDEDGGLDGSSYIFEVEKGGAYRCYSYWMPETRKIQDPDARKIVQILDEIEKETGIPWGMENDEQRKRFWTMALDSTLTSQ
jgi:hypothetical protein